MKAKVAYQTHNLKSEVLEFEIDWNEDLFGPVEETNGPQLKSVVRDALAKEVGHWKPFARVIVLPDCELYERFHK
jgi:hypothetical protein